MPASNPSSLFRFVITLLPLGLAGCGIAPTIDPSQQFRLSGAAPVAPTVLVVDGRSPGQPASPSYPRSTPVNEARLSPDVASYVAQEMTRIVQASPDRTRLEGLLAGRTIRLSHVEIVAVRGDARMSRSLSSSPPGEVAVDAVVGAIGRGLNAHGQFYVDVDVDLDAGHYISHATGSVNVAPTQDALVGPAHDAVAELVDRIANGRTSEAFAAP